MAVPRRVVARRLRRAKWRGRAWLRMLSAGGEISLLAHDSLGTGHRAVLLVHGFLGSGRNLRSLARRWVERDPSRHIVLPDLTGHGASPPLPEAPSLEDLARDLLALADALRLPRPVEIVGHSLGGRVALAALGLEPEAVSSVTMIDIPPGRIDDAPSAAVLARFLDAPARAPDRDTMRAMLVEGGVSGPIADWLVMNLERESGEPGAGVVWRVDRPALADLFARTNAEDLWPIVEAHGAALTCIRGGASPLLTDADTTRLRGAGARVETVGGAGHFVHVDAPEALVDLLATGR